MADKWNVMPHAAAIQPSISVIYCFVSVIYRLLLVTKYSAAHNENTLSAALIRSCHFFQLCFFLMCVIYSGITVYQCIIASLHHCIAVSLH